MNLENFIDRIRKQKPEYHIIKDDEKRLLTIKAIGNVRTYDFAYIRHLEAELFDGEFKILEQMFGYKTKEDD